VATCQCDLNQQKQDSQITSTRHGMCIEYNPLLQKALSSRLVAHGKTRFTNQFDRLWNMNRI
jgi:hypothetical protein